MLHNQLLPTVFATGTNTIRVHEVSSKPLQKAMEVRKSRLLLWRSQHVNSISVAILLWLSSHPTICPLAPNITLSLSDSSVAGCKEVVTIHVIRIDHHWQGPKPLFKDRKQASKNQEERAWKVGKGKMYKPSKKSCQHLPSAPLIGSSTV